MTEEPSTVLFVDDEPSIADGHAARLEDQYDTLTAYSGSEALETVDDDVDVVVLDRRMPGMSGSDVLEAIRDRGHDCLVVMLTGVEPDVDVVEMPFDAYVVKPIQGDELRETIERLLAASADEVDAAILDALGDPKARRCCFALVGESLSAQELADITGYSLPTVYRRLNTLQQSGLVESRTTFDSDGNHYRSFTAIPARIQVDLTDRVRIDVDRPDGQAA